MARPDWLAENFYDAKTGPNWEEFGKHFSEVTTRDAAEQVRKLSLPQKAEDVKLELPKDFKLPAGVEFKLDTSKPEFAKFQELAVKRGLDADTITEVLGLYAETLVGSETSMQAARTAEVNKLGANGTARINALQTFFTGLVGGDAAKQIAGMTVTAGIVQALESVVAKFSSQGVHGFRQDGREPPRPQGRVSDAEYNAMTPAQRWEYAKSFPQDQFKSNGAGR